MEHPSNDSVHSSLLYARHQDCLQIVATLAKLGLNFTHRRWPTPLQPSASTTCESKGRRRAWNSCISTFTYSGLAALKMYELKVNFVARGGRGISFCNCSLWSFGSCWNCEVVEGMTCFTIWHPSPKTCLLFKVFNPLFALEQTWSKRPSGSVQVGMGSSPRF